MAKILAALLVGLMLTGAVTATVYALPNVMQDPIAGTTQTESRLQQQSREGDNGMTQTQDQLQMREGDQNCHCIVNGPNGRTSSGPDVQGMCQNCFCHQTRIHAQNRNRVNFDVE